MVLVAGVVDIRMIHGSLRWMIAGIVIGVKVIAAIMIDVKSDGEAMGASIMHLIPG